MILKKQKEVPEHFQFYIKYNSKKLKKKLKKLKIRKKKMFFYLFSDCTRFFYSLRAI